MFTPQEVREQSESFEKAVFGGYSVSAVDDFVGSLAEDYAALYKENAVLKSKMKVLVERLEEYRKQEDMQCDFRCRNPQYSAVQPAAARRFSSASAAFISIIG